MNDNEYICGCKVQDKLKYSIRLVPVGPEGKLTQTPHHFDKEGFRVCPEHGMRLHNWKSELMKKPTKHDESKPFKPNYPDNRDNRDPEQVWAKIQEQRSQAQNGHA